MLLWEPVDAAAAAARRGNLCEDEGEASWRRCTAFKGHAAQGDVMDLSWAPDGTALASGAINNEVFTFVAAGRKRGDAAGRFMDHKHFVQVGWLCVGDRGHLVVTSLAGKPVDTCAHGPRCASLVRRLYS